MKKTEEPDWVKKINWKKLYEANLIPETRSCYGKLCYCLVCAHEEWFCVDQAQGPCTACSGTENERNTEGFCDPPEEDYAPVV